MDKKDKVTEQQEVKAEMEFPGAAIDKAEKDRETAEEVKCDVKLLNNNPRNNDIDL